MTDSVLAQPTPLTEQVRVSEIRETGSGLHVLAQVTIDPNNPILAGHYPGRPIFPGVCVIECAHHAVLIAAHSCGFRPIMKAILSARFRNAVFPGDVLAIQLVITRNDAWWDVAATLQSERGQVAKAKLRYSVCGGDS